MSGLEKDNDNKDSKDKVPGKDLICRILGLSRQSTFEEVKYSYEMELCQIESLEPRNMEEGLIKKEKKKILKDAYYKYEEEYENGYMDKMTIKRGDEEDQHNNTNKIFSFHIPCIFALLYHGMDCIMNCCCSCCGCGGSSGDPCNGCFSNNYYGECCQCIDTTIAIGGAIAGTIWLISRLGSGISNSIADKKEERRRNREVKKHRKQKDSFEKEYIPQLEKVYTEWKDLQQYTVDIRDVIIQLKCVTTENTIDRQYELMVNAIEKQYDLIEERWERLRVSCEKLKEGTNNEFYLFLEENSENYAKYIEMFNKKEAPWHNI